MSNVVRLQEGSFDITQEIERLEQLSAKDGAVGIFTGKVREDGDIQALFLEYYPTMAETILKDLCAKAKARFALSGCTVIHRYGYLPVGERIVFVGAASAHRSHALDGVSFLIDCLKTSAPFWKKIIHKNGQQDWIQQKHDDVKKRDRWSVQA